VRYESVHYQIAEKFKSVQGEGIFAGTPMAFIRFVGCSVGKKICHACDTDFDRTYPWLGGGSFSADELLVWAGRYEHICLTGGEPLDQDLRDLFSAVELFSMIHVETSGTKRIRSFLDSCRVEPDTKDFEQGSFLRSRLWICMSPKPGFLEENVPQADEIKVIVPGLGNGDGWPTIEDAIRWGQLGKPVFLQPRNEKHVVNWDHIALVSDLVKEHPELRMSVQLHKLLKVR
jgi:7-carboxy-7-deazaguanine synthase